MTVAAAIPVLVLANPAKGKARKPKASTPKKGAKSPKSNPKKNTKKRSDKPMAKKPRTAAQKAATKKMIAANRAKHGGKKKHAKKKSHGHAPKKRAKPRSGGKSAPRNVVVMNPDTVENPTEISRGAAAVQLAAGGLLGAGGAGGVDYLAGGVETFATPLPRAALHGGVGLLLLGIGIAVPKASPFFGTAGGAFLGGAGINLVKGLVGGSAPPAGKTGTVGKAPVMNKAGAPCPPDKIGPDGTCMEGVVMDGVVQARQMGMGGVVRDDMRGVVHADRESLRRMAGLYLASASLHKKPKHPFTT